MRVVIVGAGLAGGNAAVGLRESGYDGEIVLLTDEPGVPFGRPPLSKTYLRGEEDLSGWLVKPAEWYGQNDVSFDHEAKVERIDGSEHRVLIAGGRTIDYDRLVIATGCRPRLPHIDGIDLDGVMPLRTKAHCDAIRERAKDGGERVVVVGMSFIGSEVAASLRQLGCDVTAVFPGSGPLSAVLGDEVGARMTQIHRSEGVELIAGEEVSSFTGDGRVDTVVTESGRSFPCTMAVVGLGVDPNVEVLEGSGIATDNGVLVDPACRTNIDGVYAAGDVANHDHPLFGRIRVEHYNNAEKQGRHVGRNVAGDPQPYDYVHSFWSDQYDHKLEYVGFAKEWDRFVVRGDLSGAFVGFYLADGVVRAAVGLDRGGDPEAEPDSELAACAKLIRDRTAVDAGALADEDTDILQALLA